MHQVCACTCVCLPILNYMVPIFETCVALLVYIILYSCCRVSVIGPQIPFHILLYSVFQLAGNLADG